MRSTWRRARRSVSGAALAAALLALPAAAAPQAAPAPPSGAALELLRQPPARTAIASDRIYFVLPDRYANGDAANDRGGMTGPRAVTGYDPADTGFFHGGDYRGLTDDCSTPTRGVARIKALGFNAIWVTPPVRQKTVQASSAAYHGYWGLDFTTVDPHLGTEADFAAFVDCAHRLGLKVYLDVVVNHTADVILPAGGAGWVGPEERPYRDCRGRVFRPARYVFAKTFPCLAPARMPRPPFVFPAERAAKKPAWLNDPRRYHNRGDVSFDSCSELCFEQGDFFGLDDLFTEQPQVVAGLAAMHADWIRRYRVDGFRVDTAKHVNRDFFRLWVPKIRAAAREAGVRDFELFGEAFVTSAIDLAPYVRERGLPNVLDFPLQDALLGYVTGQAGAKGIATRLADDDYFQGPAGTAHTPPTFLGNHDVGRAAALVRSRSGTRGDAWLRRVLLAHDLLYLLRGAPVVLYGDEVGLAGTGGDKAARQDLFPTRVAEWQREERVGAPPIGTRSSFEVAGHPVAERLRALAALRERFPVFATGSTVVRSATGGVLVVSRIDATARKEYVAAFNAGAAPATVRIRTSTPSARWPVLLGTTEGETSDGAGMLELHVPPLSTEVFLADGVIPAPALSPPRVRASADDLTELLRVSLASPPAQPVSVAFAVKRAAQGTGGGWRRLAVDDSPPYRAFLDLSRYRRGERIHLVAVARALDGSTAVSAVVPTTVRR